MKPSKSLLVIDDDKGFCASVRDFFRDREFTTVTVQSGREGLDWCTANRAEVILLDQKLPDCEGAQLCAPLLAKCGEAKIIFITAYPSLDHAVQALRRGAHDYLSKPLELMELQLAVDRAFRTAQLERVEQLQQLHTHRESRHSIMIGESGGLLGIARLVELAAATRAPVLITGETGTGKNVVAKAIHYRGPDPSAPFVDANCGALPENLIESELFGHERGAFTGAHAVHKGLFEMADGGTLFLDEIGEIPLHLQAKLLGILDHGTLRRLGGETGAKIDVRVVAATNMDLEKAVEEKKFREDLYYRLSVLRLHLPPLRERTGDIEELSRYLMKDIAPDQELILPDKELHALCAYPWPGNVRELKNILERAIILRTGGTIYPSRLLEPKAPAAGPGATAPLACPDCPGLPILPLDDMEKLHIVKALAAFDHNHTRTAEALGIARSTLLRKLDQHCLKPGDSK